MKRFITHVFNEGLPSTGLRKISYITITNEDIDRDEFFLGTDNNPLDENEIKEMIDNGKLFPLLGNYPELTEGKSLFIDSNGILYFANRLDSDSGREKLIITIKAFTDLYIKMTADKYIPKELPEVRRYHEYV